MQQTKSYWRLVVVAGIVSAFVAGACTVTTSTDIDDDDDNGGSAGSGTAGAGTAGSSTAGTAGSGTAGAGTAGSGTAGAGTAGDGPVSFQCDPDGEGGAQGTGNTCAPSDPTDVCQKCIQAKCCAEFSACYATDPGNQCGWGGPAKVTITVDGKEEEIDNPGGELFCIQACLQKASAASGTAPEDSEVQACGNNCATTVSNGATKECGSVIGLQTNDAVGCMRDNCSVECFVGTSG